MRALLFMLLVACDDTIWNHPPEGGGSDGGGSDGGSADGGSDGGDTGDAQEGWCGVQSILNTKCTGCHGSSGAAGLDLVTDPYTAIVGVAATTGAGLVLVQPGDPDGSFLYRKATGDLSDGEGTIMPPSGGVDADSALVLYDWIAAGAGDECDEEVEDPTDRFHEEGWSDPAEHGYGAKHQVLPCTECHGADLAGGAVAPSCDSCHEDGWRTDCLFCHGGTDNETAAPPRHISGDDEGASATFVPHTTHVEQTDLKVALDCTTCHDKPVDVLSTGHIFVGDTTAGQAEVDLSGGLSSAGAWSASTGQCSNLYCHGNGRGHNGTMTHTGTVTGCDDCHPDASSGRDAWEEMSGEHEDHLREGVRCWECHGDTTNAAQEIVDVTRHVDGDVDIALSGGVTRSGGTCSGTCHGEEHRAEDWN